MTEASSSSELTVKQQKLSELMREHGDERMEFSVPSARASFGYRVAVAAVRGSLQLIIMVVVLVGASFLMLQLADSRKERPKRAQKEAVYTVETVVAETSDNRPMITVFGDVIAGRTLNLTSLVAGEVVEVNPSLRVGARVNAGETLLRINRFSFEIALAEAKANLKEAEAAVEEAKARFTLEETGQKRTLEQMDFAEVDLERAEDLLERGAVTRRSVEERAVIFSQRKAAFQSSGANMVIQQAQIEARAATVERLKVSVKNTAQALVNTTLKAPFDAIVQAVTVEVGQTVATSLSLLTLYEADTLDARFVLSDGQYGRLLDSNSSLVGRKVNVNWKIGRTTHVFPAKIDRIGAEIAANRGGVSVFARLDPDTMGLAIRPGAFITVVVPDRAFYDTFRLPETALFEGNIAYVIGPDKRLEARSVEVLVYDGDHVIVKDGIKTGEEVLITQIAEVGEGLLVRREGEEPSSLSKSNGEKTAKVIPATTKK